MDNAFKFTDEGYIELGSYIDKDNLCIYVEDTGKGIPQKKINDIFQQFRKFENEESEWTQGLGLGLAISQKIANALGGNIQVKSEPESGSTFTFNIPMNGVIIQDKSIKAENKDTLPIRWEGKTILIVEDYEANYLYLKNVLKKTKINILWAKNGKEAITQVKNNNY
jgi:chemotaxis protein histidine kinase CheA